MSNCFKGSRTTYDRGGYAQAAGKPPSLYASEDENSYVSTVMYRPFIRAFTKELSSSHWTIVRPTQLEEGRCKIFATE
jgi:hypothetical protein